MITYIHGALGASMEVSAPFFIHDESGPSLSQ